MANDHGFFAELKRRHVVRVAIAYIIAAWLIVQVATQVFPFFRIPDWAVRLVVLLLVIGFPIAVAFAWIFELTPEGLRRTAPADAPEARTQHERRSIGQKLNVIIFVVLILAVAVTGWRLYAVKHQKASAPVATVSPAAAGSASTSLVKAASFTASAPAPPRSIAVLPFENLSTDKGNAYFADGIQDLILTKLADVGDLKVISRTSTEKYKSHPNDLKVIGRQLGVATVLEGSVQKAGNQVLINVQLIDARTDSHVWAKSYQRKLDNIFGVEGEVAGKIATALNAKLSPAESADLAAVPTHDQAAYDLFLRAEYAFNKAASNYATGDYSGFLTAIPLYREAVEKDPTFALAYARLSLAESTLAWLSGENVASLNHQARADAEQARKLAPDAAATLLALGYCDYYGKLDDTGALKDFQALLAAHPNNSGALTAQGYIERRLGHVKAGIASLEKSFRLDPRNSALANEIATTYMYVSRYPEAKRWSRRALALDPNNLGAKYAYSSAILFGSGDVPRALTVLQGNEPTMQLARVSLLTYERKYQQALTLLDAIPDTPANFSLTIGATKAAMQADLHRLMGEPARARPLYRKALAALRPQLAKEERQHNGYLMEVWANVANAEIGLGETKKGLASIRQSQVAGAQATFVSRLRASVMEYNASLYAEARRPDLAVPLLAKTLVAPDIGVMYSPVMLWLDPAWDPIRHDPRFQALLKKYAKYKPAVTYASAPAAASTTPP